MGRFENIDRLFRLYYRPLCLYATHYLKDSDAVEDIVQDAFEALWEKMAVSDIQSPKSYLYASVRNSCVSRMRAANRLLEDIRPEDLSEFISDEEAVDRSFSESALWKAINDLPKKRRQMLLMEKRDGMSCAEIASALGVSVGTVKNQISRALKSLRKMLLSQSSAS